MVITEAHGAAIPISNRDASAIIATRRNATGTLIANAAKIELNAGKTVFPQPKKKPFRQKTKGTSK